MIIQPLSDRVLIQPIEDTNTSGLLIPASAKEKPHKGKVIAVGEGTPTKPMICKKDDIVYYRKGVGAPFPGGLLMMREGTDVIAIEVVHSEDRDKLIWAAGKPSRQEP